MKEKANVLHCVDLFEIFPRTISGVWQPLVTIAPLGGPLEGQVILHEEEVRRDESFTLTLVLYSDLLFWLNTKLLSFVCFNLFYGIYRVTQ